MNDYKNCVLSSFPEATCKEAETSGFGFGFRGATVYYISVNRGHFATMLGSPARTRNKAWEFAFNELQLMMLEKLES